MHNITITISNGNETAGVVIPSEALEALGEDVTADDMREMIRGYVGTVLRDRYVSRHRVAIDQQLDELKASAAEMVRAIRTID